MANQVVQVPPDSTGKKIDVSELTVGANTAQRQRVVLADDATAAALAAVTNTDPGASDYGIVARIAGTPAVTATVSGTVTANVGTSGNLALDATLTGGTQKSKLVDTGGTNVASVSAAGALKVDNSGVTQPVSDASGSLTVDAPAGTPVFVRLSDGAAAVDTLPVSLASVPSHAVTNAGTFAVQADCTGTVTANIGTSGSLALDATLTGGTQKTKLVDTAGTNVASVSAGGALLVDNSGVTQPVSGTVTAAQATASSLNAQVVGDIAHDSADSGNPVKVGGVARTANAAAVADGDRVNMSLDIHGRPIVVLNNPRELIGNQTTTITNSTTETTICTAVASRFLDLTHLSITNATATAVTVTIKDSTAGTTRIVYALAASGGIVLDFGACPWIQQAAVNNNWTATLSVNTVTVNINAQFIKNI
jgi:hypothetical protein